MKSSASEPGLSAPLDHLTTNIFESLMVTFANKINGSYSEFSRDSNNWI